MRHIAGIPVFQVFWRWFCCQRGDSAREAVGPAWAYFEIWYKSNASTPLGKAMPNPLFSESFEFLMSSRLAPTKTINRHAANSENLPPATLEV